MTQYTITERTSGTYSFSLQRDDGSALPVSALDTARIEMRAYSSSGPAMLSDRDCLNTNNVTIDSDGLVTWAFTPADMRLLSGSASQRNVARFQFTWDDGDEGLEHFVAFL